MLRYRGKGSFITRYDGELREPLVWCQGSQGFMSVAEGAHHCPRVMVGALRPLRGLQEIPVATGVNIHPLAQQS